MMKYISFLLLVVSSFESLAQSPVARYTFDCSLSDELNTYEDGFATVFPDCTCGIVNDAFNIDGSSTIELDTALSQVFQSDFAVSLYFQPIGVSNSMEILSMGDNCSSDSLFRLYYLSDMNELIWDVSESIQESASLRGDVPSNKCWTHVVLSRENNDFYLYINGDLAEPINFNGDIRFNPFVPMEVGTGSCVGVISNELDGIVDDIQIFDMHVQEFRARELYIRNDEIITNDTTIFEGEFIDISAVQTCNNSINWLPATGIQNTTEFDTELQGITTTEYIARFDGEFCVATDTLTVVVISEDDISCDQLILPNVFTPNGDGLNDDVGILNGFVIEELELFEIYDRWGERIFSTTNKVDRWDGSFRNEPVNSAMVLYKIAYTCGGESYVKTGNISILR